MTRPPVAPGLLDRLRTRFTDFPLIERWGVEILDLGPGRPGCASRQIPTPAIPAGIG